MSTESSRINQSVEQALRDLAGLRRFQGAPREFWSQFMGCVGLLTASNKVAIMVRSVQAVQPDGPEEVAPSPSADEPVPWRKIGEWAAGGGGGSRLLVQFTNMLADIADRGAAEGTLLFPLEPVPVRGIGHYVLAVRLVLARGGEVCVASCLVSEVNEQVAREGLLRLSLVADVPASYQWTMVSEQARTDVRKFASALDLMAQVDAEKRFLAASLAFCNGLATHFQCDRVSLGWLEGGYIQLRTISRTEKFDRQMAAARAMAVAMEECLDQDEEIVYPSPETANVITRDHEAFARDQKPGHMVSLPLRVEDRPEAVVTCERQTPSFTELELQELRLCCDQVARRLHDLRSRDRWFGARWVASLKHGCAKIVGPEHTWAKTLAVLVTVLVAVFLFVRVEYRVEGNFILRSDEVSFLTVPFDGFIENVAQRPGDLIRSGDVLLTLETADLELEESAALADLTRYTREAEKARAANNLAEMRISESLAAQAQARLELVRYRLEQAAIRAPFDGVVVEGDLRERMGAPVKQGDALFRVARLDSLYVEAEIDERDVHEILDRGEGEIAFVSQPKRAYPIRVETVEPAALPKKEGNVFLVRCALVNGPETWWRPGMSGLCKLSVEKRTLVWIFTHRTVDFLRMLFWW